MNIAAPVQQMIPDIPAVRAVGRLKTDTAAKIIVIGHSTSSNMSPTARTGAK